MKIQIKKFKNNYKIKTMIQKKKEKNTIGDCPIKEDPNLKNQIIKVLNRNLICLHYLKRKIFK